MSWGIWTLRFTFDGMQAAMPRSAKAVRSQSASYPLAKQGFGFGEGVDHERGAFIVTHLPLAQQHNQRSTVAVAHRVKLRVQAPFGAPDTSGNIPFFKRLAAVRWAFKWVASIIN
jgi:hypothetical protein